MEASGAATAIEQPERRDAGGRRARVLRQQTVDHRWEWWLRAPRPALAPYIAQLWVWDGETDDSRHRELPVGHVSVMFTLGPAGRVVAGAGVGPGGVEHRCGWVSGLQEGPVTVESTGRRTHVVAAELRPLGAWAFFGGLPLRELANRVFDLDAVLGASAGVASCRQRLGDATDPDVVLERMERWLATRLLAGPEAHPVLRAALVHLGDAPATTRIGPLARALGVSVRHLNGLFHREVGVSPKSLARILRLERAVARLEDGGGTDLTAVALDCGYYDQSHMNRDFRELADLTPTECLTSRMPLARPRDVG